MKLVGMTVSHKKYGIGKIIRITDNKMDVDFEFSIKTFLYPDSFEKHLVIKDNEMQECIDKKLQELNEIKREYKEQQLKREQAIDYARKTKKNVNTQAVFALNDNCIEDILNDWTIFTGNNLSGKLKGQPRIPKNMNMSSACVLTAKSMEESEKERQIIGMFMVIEDFIGEECEDGIIQAHQKYRITWSEEYEKLLFWNYFLEESRLSRWGN